MSDAFVDTTILVDALLKDGEPSAKATNALKSFAATLLPVYAIKEFKAGALCYLVWLHNKIVDTGSVGRTIAAIHAVMRRQPGRATTALDGMAQRLDDSLAKVTPQALLAQHGRTANDILCTELRLTLKYKIMSAWNQRRSTTSAVIQPLSCYPERDPIHREGRIVLGTGTCKVAGECCLADTLRKRRSEVQRVHEAASANGKLGPKGRSVLHDVARGTRSPITDQKCRSLGDAYFALFAPPNSVILTTNLGDHTVLAGPLGKNVVSP
jgi:hypothetical protein